MNSGREQELRDLLDDYVRSGLIECDADHIVSLMADDIMGIGMGEQGFIDSAEQVHQIMRATRKNDNAQYDIEISHIEIRFPAENVGNICAKILVHCTVDGQTIHSGLMQSLTVKRVDGAWKIATLHASPIILSEESIEAYPLQFADSTLAHLRAELQSETINLVTESVAGGVLATAKEEGRFPIYFVNESMLSYLGYTKEEFYAKYEYDAWPIVHPDDRAELMEKLSTAIVAGQDFQGQFRVQKSDGDYLWMLERARASTDENGKEVLLGVYIDVTEMVTLQHELEEQTRALSISEERFRIALEKTSNIIFDYDIISGNIMHSSAPRKALDYVTSVNTIQDTLIIGGRVLPESADELDRAFDQMRGGAKQAECVVKVELATGRPVWNKISMTAVMDGAGHPVRAIGMIEDITRQKEVELAYVREEQYRHAILADAMASYIVNFTYDKFENAQVRDPNCVTIEPGTTYSEFLEDATRRRMSADERRLYLNAFSSANIMEAFAKEQPEISLDYRVLDVEGKYMWMRTTIRLFLDAATGDKKGFMYVNDIDLKKREELELTRKSERDPLTGLYNKAASEEKIRSMLQTEIGVQSGVFMMLDVDYFKDINDHYGHPFGDKVLSDAARALRERFRESDIVGRIGGDEFCVFFCGVRTKKNIEELAQTICEIFRRLYIPKEGLRTPSCSVGIARCTGTVKPFEQVYEEADAALYSVKRSRRGGYAFFEQ